MMKLQGVKNQLNISRLIFFWGEICCLFGIKLLMGRQLYPNNLTHG